MRRSTIWDKPWLRRTIAALFWLGVWQTLALILPKLLFAGPVPTVQSLLSMLFTASFWLSLLHTIGKIALGYLLALGLGCLLAALCHTASALRLLLAPAVQIMKSVPVACFIVVALIWVRSAWISVITAFFVVLPIFYINLSEGLASIDPKMLEMARVFRLSPTGRLRAVYLPGVMPYMLSATRLTVGMALKAGIAGEIIGLPRYTIGEQLYLSKLYLDMSGLFAWSCAIILVSVGLEKLMVRAISAAQRRWEGAA